MGFKYGTGNYGVGNYGFEASVVSGAISVAVLFDAATARLIDFSGVITVGFTLGVSYNLLMSFSAVLNVDLDAGAKFEMVRSISASLSLGLAMVSSPYMGGLWVAVPPTPINWTPVPESHALWEEVYPRGY